MTEPAPTPLTAEQLRAAVDASMDALLVVDVAGVIQFANEAAGTFMQRSPDSLVGEEFGFPIGSSLSEPVDIDVVVGPGKTQTYEMRVAHIDLSGASPTGIPLTVVALRDVTERERANQALRSALDLRRQAGDVVAHELRTPLAAMIGYIHVLRRRRESGGQAPDEIVERMHAVTQKMARNVESFLLLARLDSDAVESTPEAVELSEVLEETVREVDDVVDGRTVRVSCPDGLEAAVDRSHLGHIVRNYLVNALRYGDDPIEVTARSNGTAVVVRVADHGEGVPADEAPYLFDDFHRGHGAVTHRGTGLGLGIARRLADLNGGEAFYEPNEPTGSCFGVRLPRPDGNRKPA